MTQNEINMAILAEIKKVANEVFRFVKMSHNGVYTAAELYKNKNAMGNNICWSIEDKEVCNKIYTIKVGASIYKIGCNRIFYALWKFEQLCGIRQKDKARFAYGVEKDEIISEKAMYYTGRKERTSDGLIVGEGDYKLRTRKTTMRKLSDNVAEDKNGRAFYYFGGLWYHINNHYGRTVATRTSENENCIYELLSRFDFSQDGEFVQIYRALFDAMKAARGNDAAEQRKSENEPENSLIRDVAKTNAEANGKNKTKALEYTEKKMRERYPGSIAIIRYGNKYYFVEESAKITRQIKDALRYICDDGGVMYCDAEQLDNIMPKLIRAGRRVIICGHVADVPKDYESKPTDQGCDTMRSICDRAGGMEGSMDKLPKTRIASATGYNLLPVYVRQKVFPTEPPYVRRKISRFKPRYFVGYTNYHLLEESAVKRKRNDNTSVYRALIRGETKNNILICR